MSLQKLFESLKGGAGSGNWGHAGVPGKRGGSSPRSFAMSRTTGRDYQERQLAKKGKTPAMDAQAVKNFEDRFKSEEKVKDAQQNISYINSQLKKWNPPPHLKRLGDAGKRAWEAEKDRMRASLPERQKELDSAKAEFAKLKNTKAPGFGEYTKIQTSSGGTYGTSKSWEHPQYGKVGYSYSGKLYTQNVAASGSVTWTSPNGINYRKEWSGQTALDSIKNYMKDTFGIAT